MRRDVTDASREAPPVESRPLRRTRIRNSTIKHVANDQESANQLTWNKKTNLGLSEVRRIAIQFERRRETGARL